MTNRYQMNDFGEMLASFHAYETDESPKTAEMRRQQKQRREEILKGILKSELTLRQRQFMMMYYFENKTIPQIAAELGINKSTVCRSMQAACRRIQTCMKYWM